jgi:hypothetical protein
MVLGCGTSPTADRDAATGSIPTVLYARPGVTAGAITTDGDFLYWREVTFTDSAIVQAPLDGQGPVVRLGPSRSAGISIIVTDATHIYWLVDDANISKLARSGGAIENIPLQMDYPPGVLAGDAGHLYVAYGNCQAIARVAKTGGAVTRIENPIAERNGGGTSVVVDDTRIYCGSGNDGRLFAGEKAGSTLETLFQVEPAQDKVLSTVVMVGDSIYVWQVRGGPQDRHVELLRIGAPPGAPEAIAAFNDGPGGGVLGADPSGLRLYWLTGVPGNGVALGSFDVATRQRTVTKVEWTQHGVAVTNDHAYWINANIDTSFIMRMPTH